MTQHPGTGVKFRVPVTDNALTIEWLCGDVAARYQRHHKLAPNTISICELRGSDGSVLDVTDAVSDVADDMEELVGIISTSTSTDSTIGAGLGYGDAHEHASGKTVVPEPPIGGVPMGRSSSQHARTKASGAQEGPVQATDAAMRPPGNPLPVDEEELDSWAKVPLGIKSYDGHPDGVTCLLVAHETLVSGGRDRLVRVWDLEERKCRAQLEGHTSNVRCIGMARGLLVSGGEAAVRIWDVGRTWRQSGSLLGHNHFVSALSLDEELRLVTARCAAAVSCV